MGLWLFKGFDLYYQITPQKVYVNLEFLSADEEAYRMGENLYQLYI